MNLGVTCSSFNTFGGNTLYSLAGEFLQSGINEYGSAITAIEITVCFRGGVIPHPSLQKMYDDFHSTSLPALPLVKFYRKKARLTLQYETVVTDATFLKRYGFPSIETFSQVLREVAEKFHLIDTHLKKSDDFDLSRFHRDISALIAAAPQCDDDLRKMKDLLDTKDKERRAAMDPWDRLGIEWEQYHPMARTLLNDPFFWDLSSDYSPHGNDTGADLLSEFKKWNRRHPHHPAHEMARNLLRRWDLALIDVHTVDEGQVQLLFEKDPIAISVTDEAMIAAAFAAVKLRGCCDSETRELALNAIERERKSAVIIGRGWKYPSERLMKLDLIAESLRRLPESSKNLS